MAPKLPSGHEVGPTKTHKFELVSRLTPTYMGWVWVSHIPSETLCIFRPIFRGPITSIMASKNRLQHMVFKNQVSGIVERKTQKSSWNISIFGASHLSTPSLALLKSFFAHTYQVASCFHEKYDLWCCWTDAILAGSPYQTTYCVDETTDFHQQNNLDSYFGNL